jgi:hypothetical protein
MTVAPRMLLYSLIGTALVASSLLFRTGMPVVEARCNSNGNQACARNNSNASSDNKVNDNIFTSAVNDNNFNDNNNNDNRNFNDNSHVDCTKNMNMCSE